MLALAGTLCIIAGFFFLREVREHQRTLQALRQVTRDWEVRGDIIKSLETTNDELHKIIQQLKQEKEKLILTTNPIGPGSDWLRDRFLNGKWIIIDYNDWPEDPKT